MCGICGIIESKGAPLLGRGITGMCQAAAHRGPDDWGTVLFPIGRQKGIEAGLRNPGVPAPSDDGQCVLGHLRLSIIDLSDAGHQPMSDPTGRYWIVYNGEVYNYVEIREELQKAGRTFRSRTDTEVLLQAYMEWGSRCLERFNGMWAFAIYDCHAGRLFCARDRFGIKPFYYACEKGRFAFASEIKQLLSLSWVGAEANRDRLADFFLWGLETHTDESFFKQIRSLPGSHYVELTREDVEQGRFEPKRYWMPMPGERLDEKQAIVAFRDLLADSVRLRLRSDVPVGVTLSGGLDSSSVVCLAGEHRRRDGTAAPLNAFNVEFEGLRYSERRFAEAAATQAGARMVVLRPGQADLARDWTRFVWHMEEPFGSLSFFSNFQIYKLIREQGISVVLSGQGGDELLLGYERYRTYDTLFQLRAMHPWAALTEIMKARRHANMSLRIQAESTLYFSLPFLRAHRRRNLVRPILSRDFFNEYAGNTLHLRRSMSHKNRFDLQGRELFHYQLPHLLRHEDRMSMAHSVETRLPFLDYRLLELVLGQSVRMLFCEGWSKYILRQAMEGIVPTEVQHRTDKMGYETPTGGLIRQNREIFLPLLARHRDDPCLNVPGIERRFESNALDERSLCRAMSYLSWKETFSVP